GGERGRLGGGTGGRDGVVAVDHEGPGLLVEPGRNQNARERGRRGGALFELEIDGEPIQKVCLSEQSRRLAAARRFAGALRRRDRLAHSRPPAGARDERIRCLKIRRFYESLRRGRPSPVLSPGVLVSAPHVR